jgi:hypothetical protein
METETEWVGRIAGVFEGYRSGRVFQLSDGRRWRQESQSSEYAYRESPAARLLWNRSTGMRFLDVEGTSGVVNVVPDSGMRGMGGGAF